MAQATKSSSRRSGSSSRNGSSSKASSSSRRGRRSNGSQTQRKRSSASSTRSRAKSTGRSGARSGTGAVSSAGGTVAQIASKAKTPLIAAGAVLAGVAGGLALRSQNHKSRNPLKKMSAPSIDLSKIDLDSLTSAAQRVGKIGQQVGDVAEATEKARKKHK